MTARDALARVRELLTNAEIPDAEFDALCLCEDLLSCRPMAVHSDKEITEQMFALLLDAAKKRCEGIPLQYILGEWEFFGLPFKVGEGVLIPRPDTETLVETALEHLKRVPTPKRVLDLCSGSGCVAIAIEKNCPDAEVSALELSEQAREYLRQNIALNHSSVRLIAGDALSEKQALIFENLSLITANPPYLTKEDLSALQREVGFEPKMALDGGADGLMFYRLLPALWLNSLNEGGMLAVEIGAGQEKDVCAFFKAAGYREIRQIPDYTGTIRVISGIRSTNTGGNLSYGKG